MNVNELIIGGWYLLNGKPINVEGYCRGNIIYDGGYECNLNELERIPLTEDILKANGFDAKDVDTTCFYSKEVGIYLIVFHSENGCPILTIEDVVDLEDEHNVIQLKDEIYDVHELQRALRCCGLWYFADTFKIKADDN